MSWSEVIESGSGAVAFRLEIEGWPHVWVTDPAITFATNKDGREVYPGLQYEGLRIQERLIMRDFKLEVSGMTVTICPTNPTEETLRAFTMAQDSVGRLADGSDMDADDTAMVLANGDVLATGVYHIGTEAIRFDSGTELAERAVWGTQAQHHVTLNDVANPTQALIYAHPPSCLGRRARLYAYARGDDYAGDGTQIWIGVVTRAPKLDRDGISWTIGLDPVTRILDQDMAAREDTWRPRGVYHSNQAPFYIVLNIDGTERVRWVRGHFESWQLFCNAVNAELADMLSDYTYTNITSMQFAYATATNAPRLGITTGATAPTSVGGEYFMIFLMGSPIIGVLADGAPPQYLRESGAVKYVTGTSVPIQPTHITDTLDASTSYTFNWDDADYSKGAAYHGSFATGPGWTPDFAASVLGTPHKGTPVLGSREPPIADNATYPPNRIYLDGAVAGIDVGDSLVFSAPATGIATGLVADVVVAQVTAKDNADNYVDVSFDTSLNVERYINQDTEIRVLRVSALAGSIDILQDSVVTEAPRANMGDSPHITMADMEDWVSVPLLSPTARIERWVVQRDYIFSKPVSFLEVITEESKMLCMMPRTSSTGKYDFFVAPDLTSVIVPEWTIVDADVLEPGKGLDGKWGGWDEAADGVTTSYKLELGYNPETDEYNEEHTFAVKDAELVARHKSRGRGEMKISPKSSVTNSFGKQPSMDIAIAIVSMIKTRLAQSCIQYTIKVPFTKFAALIGSVGQLTYAKLPNGNGTRGVTEANAMVIGRSIPLDPKAGTGIDLTLIVSRESLSGGYTASGFVDAQADNGGDEWELTFDDAHVLNIVFSPLIDGVVTTHMRAGDMIALVQYDDETPTTVTGTVVSVDGENAITVQLDATWTPGSDDWIVEWQEETAATARQKAFTYLADDERLLYSGELARRFR